VQISSFKADKETIFFFLGTEIAGHGFSNQADKWSCRNIE
jgi:hypothetical protein